MASVTLTINHADGGSETYTINRDKFVGVTEMSLDGETISVDHSAIVKSASQETTFSGSQSITLKRDIDPLLKDVAGGAVFAISMRNLNDGLSNESIIKVRRSNDSTTNTFSHKEIKDGTLLSWVGDGNTGFIEEVYDQSGNNVTLSQSDSAGQTEIVTNNKVNNGFLFDGTSDHLTNTEVNLGTSDFSMFTCFTPPSDTFDGVLLGAVDNKWLCRLLSNAITLRDTNGVIRSMTLNENMVAGQQYIISVIRSGTSVKAYVNGVEQSSTRTINSTDEFRFDRVGVRGASGNRLEGEVSEVVVYPSDLTSSRMAIEENISNAFPKKVDVFLLLGQSNMVGFPSDLYPATTALSSSNDSKVWFAGSVGTRANEDGDLLNNSVGYDTEGLIKLDAYAAQSRFGYGPNLDFARTLVNDHNYENLGIIKWARNGTALDVYWKKSANKFYPTLVAYCNEQIAALKTTLVGYKVNVAGIFWFQGHGDSTIQTRADAYEANLTQLMADLRSDITDAKDATLIIGRSPDFWKLPYEAGEPAADAQKVANVDTIKNAQVSVATSDGNAVWISTDDATALEPWVSGVSGSNPIHLTTDDKQALGVRAANAFVSMTNYTG